MDYSVTYDPNFAELVVVSSAPMFRTAVPAPASVSVFGFGLLGLAARYIRSRRRPGC